MTIRQANIKDLETVGRINFISMTTTYRAFVPKIEQQISLEGRISRLSNWFNSKESPRVIFLAYEGQTAVGYGACAHKIFQGYLAELRSFHVLPSYQKRGVGSHLFNRMVTWLIQSNINSLFVEAAEANPFHRFYAKKGGQLISNSVQKAYGLDLNVVTYGWNDLHKLQSIFLIKERGE